MAPRGFISRHGSFEHVMEQTVDRRQIAVGGEPTGVTSHKGDVRGDQTGADGMQPMMIPISGERKSKISVSISINSGRQEQSTTARDQALEEAREQLRRELDPENLTRGPPSPSKIPPKFLGSGFSSLQDIEAGTSGDAVIHGDPRCRPGTAVKLAPGYENNPEWPQLRKHAGKQGVLVREVSGGWGWIAKFGDGEETFRTRDGIYMLCYLIKPKIVTTKKPRPTRATVVGTGKQDSKEGDEKKVVTRRGGKDDSEWEWGKRGSSIASGGLLQGTLPPQWSMAKYLQANQAQSIGELQLPITWPRDAEGNNQSAGTHGKGKAERVTYGGSQEDHDGGKTAWRPLSAREKAGVPVLRISIAEKPPWVPAGKDSARSHAPNPRDSVRPGSVSQGAEGRPLSARLTGSRPQTAEYSRMEGRPLSARPIGSRPRSARYSGGGLSRPQSARVLDGRPQSARRPLFGGVAADPEMRRPMSARTDGSYKLYDDAAEGGMLTSRGVGAPRYVRDGDYECRRGTAVKVDSGCDWPGTQRFAGARGFLLKKEGDGWQVWFPELHEKGFFLIKPPAQMLVYAAAQKESKVQIEGAKPKPHIYVHMESVIAAQGPLGICGPGGRGGGVVWDRNYDLV